MIKTDNSILSDIYFGRLSLQERSVIKNEDSSDCNDFLNGLELGLRKKIDGYLSSENLKTTRLEAEAFARGCSFTLNFILECLQTKNIF